MFSGMDISASALTSQRLRMDVTSANISNADTTRGRLVDGEWEPYRRKMVHMQSDGEGSRFQHHLHRAAQGQDPHGVRINQIIEDETPFEQQYNPDHPDADEDGYVAMPNVDPLKEMVDLMGATRSYEANVTALDAHKGMLMRALEIGR
ncbi:flagellar basal body rod protein FlgC [Alkalicoccus chagannorensis]|uniref:flagellar basal body rod protein FlgC n=1 Tax=Alkalicoccus chagannorensis TaxID=427072 RepID=UPI000426C1F1|nr:flagellar basal body rod protein FlgC [Alkalicoccus chagannorensis]